MLLDPDMTADDVINKDRVLSEEEQVELEQKNLAKRQQKLRELESFYRTESLLLGVSTEGEVHCRPLCTSADVALAAHELLDKNLFKSGVVLMPQMLNAQLHRHLQGYFRFHYSAKQESTVEFIT